MSLIDNVREAEIKQCRILETWGTPVFLIGAGLAADRVMNWSLGDNPALKDTPLVVASLIPALIGVYTLLGVLITRLAVLFNADGPPFPIQMGTSSFVVIGGS